jgi:hypothetical protein
MGDSYLFEAYTGVKIEAQRRMRIFSNRHVRIYY